MDEYLQNIGVFYDEKVKFLSGKDKFLSCDDCKDNIIGFTENGVLVCHACQKKQVKKCPICLEDKSPAELCVLGCHHSFCWRCYGMGCMSGEQIVKCPECRAEIIEVKEIMA